MLGAGWSPRRQSTITINHQLNDGAAAPEKENKMINFSDLIKENAAKEAVKVAEQVEAQKQIDAKKKADVESKTANVEVKTSQPTPDVVSESDIATAAKIAQFIIIEASAKHKKTGMKPLSKYEFALLRRIAEKKAKIKDLGEFRDWVDENGKKFLPQQPAKAKPQAAEKPKSKPRIVEQKPERVVKSRAKPNEMVQRYLRTAGGITALAGMMASVDGMDVPADVRLALKTIRGLAPTLKSWIESETVLANNLTED